MKRMRNVLKRLYCVLDASVSLKQENYTAKSIQAAATTVALL